MAIEQRRIKVRSIQFGAAPFRKLGNFRIDFAERITLIAGHNGIGKSTIQGLVANTFGVPKGGSKSYFGEAFSANIERMIYLALEEVETVQHESASPVVVADVGGVEVQKRCAMTRRTEYKRARVVPRTIGGSDHDTVGQDAKVPLPTIYLGMTRLASFGEADESDVESKKFNGIDEGDRRLVFDFVSQVILGVEITDQVTDQSIKASKKKTVQPGYLKHGPFAVSMGQDSLASIVTALASFNRLKREQGDAYPGGLLVIDELDVGFHPHAIGRLVDALKTYANKLDLQVIATTHSPLMIEAVHPDGGGDQRAPDKVIYLLDTKHPRLAEDQSLAAVLNDMSLRQVDDAPTTRVVKPVLAVYFEDAEGAQFCDALMPRTQRNAIAKKYDVKIKLIPLGVGGSNLTALPEKDPLFKDRVLIVDADTKISRSAQQRGNTIKLPCHQGAQGTDRSPENVIKIFLKQMIEASNGPLYDALLRFSVPNPTSDKVLATFFPDGVGASAQRDSSKGWWTNNWAQLKHWGVVREWAICHANEKAQFVKNFDAAVAKVALRITH